MKTVPIPCACTSVRKVARSLARAYDSVLSPGGLNVTQLAVMRAIQRHTGESMARVAEDLSMDRTSFYRSLSPLKRDGLIRVVDGPGGPSRTVEITRSGQRILESIAPQWEAMQTAIVDRFGRSAWRKLAAELKRLEDCIPQTGEGGN